MASEESAAGYLSTNQRRLDHCACVEGEASCALVYGAFAVARCCFIAFIKRRVCLIAEPLMPIFTAAVYHVM